MVICYYNKKENQKYKKICIMDESSGNGM